MKLTMTSDLAKQYPNICGGVSKKVVVIIFWSMHCVIFYLVSSLPRWTEHTQALGREQQRLVNKNRHIRPVAASNACPPTTSPEQIRFDSTSFRGAYPAMRFGVIGPKKIPISGLTQTESGIGPYVFSNISISV